MYKFYLGRKLAISLSIVILTVFSIGCEDDPVTPQEEHLEAIGMVFYQSGIEIARILRGETSDTLTAPEGGLSDHTEVNFFDEDENIIDPPEMEHTTLSWEIDDETVVDVWQHQGEEGEFEFHLQGLEEGETMIEFFVMHEDHSDYRSGKIPVRVEHEEGSHGEPVGFDLFDEESGNLLITVNETEVTGSVSVTAGTITDHMEVEFFDEYGVHFSPAVPPHTLLVEIADTTVASIDGLEEEEPWAFAIKGLKTGSTQVTIKILHDGNVGKEFSSFTLNVN